MTDDQIKHMVNRFLGWQLLTPPKKGEEGYLIVATQSNIFRCDLFAFHYCKECKETHINIGFTSTQELLS